MTSKNISIKKATYDKLIRLKGNAESFTEVIEFLLQNAQHTGKSLEPFFGLWDEEPEITLDTIYRHREEMNAEWQEKFS